MLVLHGRDDEEVPVGNSRGLARVRPQVRLVELDGVEHYGLIDPGSAAWPTVRSAVLAAATGSTPGTTLRGGRLET